MRTVIATILILVVFVVGTLILNRYINTSCEKLLNDVKELHTSVEDSRWTDVKKQVAGLNKEWEDTKKRWQLFLEHYEIDAIDIVLSRLEQYAEIENKALAIGETAELRFLISHIKDKEDLKLINIL